jgi:hypothetical protein
MGRQVINRRVTLGVIKELDAQFRILLNFHTRASFVSDISAAFFNRADFNFPCQRCQLGGGSRLFI